MGTGGDCDDVDRDRDHGCDGVVVVMKMLRMFRQRMMMMYIQCDIGMI